MRAAIIAIMILMLPAALFAGQVGVFFTYTPNQMWFSPAPFEEFVGYVYGHSLPCYVQAIEFAVELPPGIELDGWTLPPEGILQIGNPLTGIAIAYWPPLNGFYPGYNLLLKIYLFADQAGACLWKGGSLVNAPLRILPNPESGHCQVACYPDATLMEVTGLTSIICPDQIATEESSWGAIKSLF